LSGFLDGLFFFQHEVIDLFPQCLRHGFELGNFLAGLPDSLTDTLV